MARDFISLADPESLPDMLARPVLAIGNFDGMHLGHAALVAEAVRLGAAINRPAVILTFEPHPRAFFDPTKPLFRLTPPALKAEAAADLGADGAITLAFGPALAGLAAEAFVDELIGSRLGASGVVVGPNFRFGSHRRGDSTMLEARAAAIGIAASIVPPVQVEGEIVSSSRIRLLLGEGDVSSAARLLGRQWKVRATVAHGDKRGRTLGYPTANLLLDKGVKLRHGIYAVTASVGGSVHKAVASFGSRPTFDDGAPRLEVHVFDFAGDLYGQEMDVSFAGWIRPELKFDGVDALIRQMDEDSLKARAILA